MFFSCENRDSYCLLRIWDRRKTEHLSKLARLWDMQWRAKPNQTKRQARKATVPASASENRALLFPCLDSAQSHWALTYQSRCVIHTCNPSSRDAEALQPENGLGDTFRRCFKHRNDTAEYVRGYSNLAWWFAPGHQGRQSWGRMSIVGTQSMDGAVWGEFWEREKTPRKQESYDLLWRGTLLECALVPVPDIVKRSRFISDSPSSTGLLRWCFQVQALLVTAYSLHSCDLCSWVCLNCRIQTVWCSK